MDLNLITKIIENRHNGDAEQLRVIFSSSKKILVEAPAGYGKTNTMVSKIAYMIASMQIPYPKKLLALTFSVNAAYKIKKDVSNQVPILLKESGNYTSLSDKIYVSNYHGFCRNILRKYGHILSGFLKNIDTLHSVNDSKPEYISSSIPNISYDDASFLSDYCIFIKTSDITKLTSNIDKYNSIIIEKVLPKGFITYNAILTLTLKLFAEHKDILLFYKAFYSSILIDEFQDTNYLCYEIIKKIISDKTTIIFLGDSLQRIYGFIGAVKDLLSISKEEFGLEKIELMKNYRFASNPYMLQLDRNIRKNAENPYHPSIEKVAEISLKTFSNQNAEALYIAKGSQTTTQKYNGSKIAILVKQRGNNVDMIINAFNDNNIQFFYGLFTDEDISYISFHRQCNYFFIDLIRNSDNITKKLSKEHIKKIKNYYSNSYDQITESLLSLLIIFWDRIFTENSWLSNEDKINFIKDTFEHNGLKQYIEFIKINIIISTVHAAKGLEWDFVILPDMEQYSFPGWHGLCSYCLNKQTCSLIVSKENESHFLEELSVFYVAVTRARKNILFTRSKINVDGKNRELSCFLKLPGIKSKE